MTPSGHSGTPLAKKLGIRGNSRVRLINQPSHYFRLLTDLPPGVRFARTTSATVDLIHYFAVNTATLEKDLPSLKKAIGESGVIWVSWPKKSSKMKADLGEDIIRAIALKNGLVDVKVCAVDEVWSGLKLVIRLKDRR
jgi:hypothetical protein